MCEHPHTLHSSREAYLLRGLRFSPHHQSEGAERRQALGCSGTRRRASDGGPQASADALHPTQTSLRSLRIRGCSPLGAPPRRLLAPTRLGETLRANADGAVPFNLTLAHSRVPLVVAEGRCCRTPPGSLLAWSNSQDAASRPASQMPRDDTSSGRDTANIGNCSALSNERKALSNVFCRYPVDERSVKRKVSPTPSAQSASTAFCYQTHA